MGIFSNRLFQISLLTVLFVITLFFSTYRLTESPAVWYDEGFYQQAAINLVQHGVWGIQTGPNEFSSLRTVTAGFPLILPIALSFKFFGIGVLQARLVMVLFIVALLAATYFFVKRSHGFYFAIASCSLLATLPTLYGNGKTVLGEVPAILFLTLFLYFLHIWFESNKHVYAAAAGLLLGLAVSAKVSFLITALPALLITFIFFYKYVNENRKGLVFFSTSFLISLSVWLLTQFNVTTDSVSIFIDTTFRHYNTGPVESLFLNNLLKFFLEATPLYLLFLMVIWFIALIQRHRLFEIKFISEIFAFIFAVLNIGIFLLSPGWYRYFFPAVVIAILFFPSALYQVIILCSTKLKLPQKNSIIFIVAVIGFFSLVQTYQTLRSSFVASYYNSKRTARLESDIKLIPRDRVYFLYDTPEVVIFLPPNIQFYQFLNSHPRYAIGDNGTKLILRGVPDSVIISIEKYAAELDRFNLYSPASTIANKFIILNRKKTDKTI